VLNLIHKRTIWIRLIITNKKEAKKQKKTFDSAIAQHVEGHKAYQNRLSNFSFRNLLG
jgi:hypothetical protein